MPGDPRLPSQAEISRVLAPHQTVQERNLALEARSWRYSPIWLRMCYAPELTVDYANMTHGLAHIIDTSHFLDNEALHGGFDDDWAQVLKRIPSLPDAVEYIEDPELRVEIEWKIPRRKLPN